MLLQFVVENHRSFRNRAVLSMLAASGEKHEPGQVLPGPDGRSVLRMAALYGANGSGKSNLVDALHLMVRVVLRGTRADDHLPMQPFKFDRERSKEPSHFAVELALGDKRYSYGFEATAAKVHAEWLYEVGPGDTERALFEREAGEKMPRIELGDALSTDPERRGFLAHVAQGTRQNQLFLAEAGERNVTELDEIRDAFKSWRCLGPTTRYSSLVEQVEADDEFRVLMGHILKQAGTGIHDLRVLKQSLGELTDEWREFMADSDQVIIDTGRETTTLRLDADGNVEAPSLHAVHRVPGGAEFTLALREESDGTQRLLDLAPMFHMLEKNDSDTLFVIDELERSLHPLLSRYLLRRFTESESSHATQLIFTTHDTALLDARDETRLLSRDSIWLVEKDVHGGSVIYPLSDVDRKQVDQVEEQGKGLERGYLQGRFGAIPFLGAGGPGKGFSR